MEGIPIPTTPKPTAQVLISLMEDGSVRVEGPIQNKVICYGLMETAKEIIARHKAEPQSPILTPRIFG